MKGFQQQSIQRFVKVAATGSKSGSLIAVTWTTFVNNIIGILHEIFL